ncbi:MAG: steroid delta-isomerase, partial [Flavobacteriaceae bacterium]
MYYRLLSALLLIVSSTAIGQSNTEIYLFDLNMELGNPVLSNPKNISNNEGYDNQPSFLNNNTVLFSATRDDQTDILRFNIEEGSTSIWISNTPTGSEYSPLKIPGKDAISAIRLDLDGLQLLYQYNPRTGDSEPLLENLKVGYHTWYNDSIVVSSVLVADRMDLVVSNIKDGSNKTLQRNVGRSLWKIPNTNLISYISKEKKEWEIKSINPLSGVTEKIAQTYKNAEDMCWLNQTTMLTGSGKSILKFDTTLDIQWQKTMKFEQDEINDITRMAINQNGNRLAFVSEESPVNIVQKQVNTFNNEDLYGFVSCYSESVLAQRFPNDTMYVGKTKMTESYKRFYQNTESAKVEVNQRIRIGNKVIDEEFTLVDGRKGHQVAMYEIKNGLIASMTFIFPKWKTEDAESV